MREAKFEVLPVHRMTRDARGGCDDVSWTDDDTDAGLWVFKIVRYLAMRQLWA